MFWLTLLHSERPKLHRVLAVLSATGLNSLFDGQGIAKPAILYKVSSCHFCCSFQMGSALEEKNLLPYKKILNVRSSLTLILPKPETAVIRSRTSILASKI